MARTPEAKVRFSVFNEEFRQGINEITQDTTRMRKEFKLEEEQMKHTTSSSGKLEQNIRRLGREKENVQAKIKLTEKQLASAKEYYGENSEEARKLEDQLLNLQISEQKIENAIQQSNTELEKQRQEMADGVSQSERYKRSIEDIGKSLQDTGQRMMDFGKGMRDVGKKATMYVTTPIVGAGTAALTAGMNFEEGMSKVEAISGATGEDLQQLEDIAKDLGGTTRFSATEAASGMEYLAMAGFETNEIIESMPGLLDLAASSNMDLGRAADIASNIISGFGYEADQAGRVADVLAAGASSANTNVEQLGDAMATVAPIASALGLDVEGLTAGIGMMSDAGIQGSTAGRQLRQGLLRLSDPTGAAADLIEELGINVFDSEGNMKELHDVVDELSGGLDGMSSQAQTAALSTLFGSQSVAGWTALIERGSDELADYTGDLEDAEGAASDMADTMQDNAKGALVEMQSALEGAAIEVSEHIIPLFTDLVESATEVVRKFGELDENTQKNIIMMGGLAAAIGPVLVVLGSMTTAVGGIVRTGGTLLRLLGRAGGAGLIGRLGMLGMGGPVGIAIGAITGLGVAVYNLTKDKEDLNDVNWDVVEGMRDEVEATDKLIDRFVELEDKNKLTREEMMRYMDILDQLKQTDSPKEIERLTEEQENLLEASGFTNEEMEEFLGLNDQIIEKAPETAGAISEEGNAYAENLDKLKALNEEKRQEMLITAERELINALENEAQLLQDQKDLVAEIKGIYDDIDTTKNEMTETTQRLQEEEETLKGIQEDILAIEGDTSREAANKREQLERQRTEQSGIVEGLRVEKDELDETYERLADKLGVKNDDLEVTREELRELDKVQAEYESLILAQADITAERGRGLEAIDEELKKIDQAKDKLEEQRASGELTTGEYQDMNSELSTQRQRLIEAKGQLEQINDLAGRTVYDKQVNISTSPTIGNLDSQLGRSIRKRVNLDVSGGAGGAALGIPGYAEGTSGHPARGPAIVGEEGPELVRQGNQWSLHDFGLIPNLKKGAQVFTADQTKKLMSSIKRLPKNLPAYANGVGVSNNAANEINMLTRASHSMNNIDNNMNVSIEATDVIMDGRVVGSITWKVVQENIDLDNRIRESFRGD